MPVRKIKDKVKVIEKSPEDIADIKEKVLSSGLSEDDIEVILASLDLMLALSQFTFKTKNHTKAA